MVGSCIKLQCDLSGRVVQSADDKNYYDDGNPCTADACVGTDAQNTFTPKAPCPLPNQATGFCRSADYNGVFACVECDEDLNCKNVGIDWICVAGKCGPGTCTDKVLTAGETDVDCGGLCPKCGDDSKCNYVSDCLSGVCNCTASVCTHKTCKSPTCFDSVVNGRETDVDCGGICPTKCSDGQHCWKPTDCASKVCLPATDADAGAGPNVCHAPTCTDGVQNGTETGMDCGGTSCAPCVP